MLRPNAITHCVSGMAAGARHDTLDKTKRWPLHDVQATRHIEQEAQSALPFNTLMQRAGFASAQLALAIAPHA